MIPRNNPHTAVYGNRTPRANAVTVREFLVQGLLLVILLVALFPGTFFRGELLYPATLLLERDPWQRHAPEDAPTLKNGQVLDYVSGYAPFYYAMTEALNDGEWPLWSPYMNCGAPLAANYQTGLFYPPHLCDALFGHFRGGTLFILLRVWLCGATAYICGRGLGLSIGASRFLSFAWMLCGYNTHWYLWTILDVSAWWPLLFLATEWILAHRYRKGFFLMLGSGLLMLLGGHPESAFGFATGLSGYFLLRLLLDWREKKPVWAPIGVFAAPWVIALLAASIQVLPFFEYVHHSSTFAERVEGTMNKRVFPTIPGEAAAALWVPRFFGATTDDNLWRFTRESPFMPGQTIMLNSNFIGVLYPGIGVWFCMAPLLLRRISGRLNRRRLLCMIPVALIGVLFAFNHPISHFADFLPVFSTIHRLYFICFFLFLPPLLGAIGIDRWLSRRREKRDLWPLLVPAFVIVANVSLLLLSHWPTLQAENLVDYVLFQVCIALFFGGLAIAILALRCVWNRPRILANALAIVLAVDLLVAARDLRPTTPRNYIPPESKLFPYLESLPGPARFSLLSAEIMTGPHVYYGVELFYGYDALCPARLNAFRTACYPGAWDTMEPVAAVNYYLFREGSMTEGSEKFELLASIDGFDVCRNRHVFPRVRLVGNLEVLPDGDAVLERISQPDFDPATTAVTEFPVNTDSLLTDTTELGTAKITARTLNACTVEVTAHQPCVLVLADTYFPGWKASLDGAPTDMFPVYYAFRGVIVPAGEHVIRFWYDPLIFRIGTGLSVVTLLAGGLVALIILLRRPGQGNAR